ncbi:MAG TPA: preprotein translocase subunit SecF, partial [Methanoregula sp.]|nr:preprotein translocase subunit SecF [Methanoregula sp.]
MGLINYNIEKYSPKQLVIIPLAILAVSVVLLSLNMVATGMPVTPGIDFSGGTAVTIFTADTREQIQSAFAGYPLVDISEGVNNGKFLKFGAMDDTKFQSLTALIYQKFPDAKVDQIGETFGKTLQSQALLAMVFSFIGMSVVIFISFRTFVPSVAVVLSAFADMAM